ncbi:MAG: LEA type 2 family protein [Flavobacteriales bacterium]
MIKQIGFLFLLLLIGCKVKEKPEFIKIESIQVLNTTSQHITLQADALFNNPNHIGGTLSSEGIVVSINDVEMATVSSESFKVPAKKEFTIPLRVQIPTEKIVNKNNLKGLLNSLFSQKLKVQYKGIIKYKIIGFSHTYLVDETEDVKIKL